MHSAVFTGPLEQVSTCCFRIPKSYKSGMRVDGLIYADESMIERIMADRAPEQVANVATLPGIQVASIAMPDIHWGYGFCIGGVCITDPREGGVTSPGGVGYDINCGVRLVRFNLAQGDVLAHIDELVRALVARIPCEAGKRGNYSFDRHDLSALLRDGPSALIARGMGVARDVEYTDAGGRVEGADPEQVSDRAMERGSDQCGTLGGGNHFLEVQVVEAIVHRKGATRAFPPGHPELPAAYRGVGQPVLIPGSMGTASWVLVGREGSICQTFGSTCHGAGRTMSRTRAVAAAQRRRIERELAADGVVARAKGWRSLAEEQPAAYKNVDLVVEVVERAGLSRKVARLRPIGVIKG